MTEAFDRKAFTALIDAAIEEFRGRELVHAVEAVDVLLDLRLTVLDASTISELLAAPSMA